MNGEEVELGPPLIDSNYLIYTFSPNWEICRNIHLFYKKSKNRSNDIVVISCPSMDWPPFLLVYIYFRLNGSYGHAVVVAVMSIKRTRAVGWDCIAWIPALTYLY